MTDRDVVVRLANVGKEYVKYEDVPTLLTGLIKLPTRGRRARLWAIRDLSIEVRRGESIGVIGRNGAGKSTTLAMVAGVTAPSEGVVSVRGRLAPLLQLGVGFHPELTGRENVYLNCTVLGMRRREIDEAFDSIVDFAEIERFIDTPVKFYSSGMLVRLGFASAVAARPDILLVDEVLAVGDIGFQRKSFERMSEMRDAGATLMVVSHNIQAVRQTCSRVVVVNAGRPVFDGAPTEAIAIYHRLLRESQRIGDGRDAPVRILSFDLLTPDGAPTADVTVGDVVTFRAHVRFERDVEDPSLGVWIATESGTGIYGENAFGTATGRFEAGSEAYCDVRTKLTLASGNYIAGAGLRFGRETFEHVPSPELSFSVAGRPSVQGVVDLNGVFDMQRVDQR
jgi:ABC-type polysaccharide/polyol phosphate transport system ATPase subunit